MGEWNIQEVHRCAVKTPNTAALADIVQCIQVDTIPLSRPKRNIYRDSADAGKILCLYSAADL